MRKADGAKHGVIRSVDNIGFIFEQTYFEDKKHGLSFIWWNDSYSTAFRAVIWDHGKIKASIDWNKDWSELYSDNKELILKNDGLSLFKH